MTGMAGDPDRPIETTLAQAKARWAAEDEQARLKDAPPSYEPKDEEFLTSALVSFWKGPGGERAFRLATSFGQQTVKLAWWDPESKTYKVPS